MAPGEMALGGRLAQAAWLDRMALYFTVRDHGGSCYRSSDTPSWFVA